MKIYSNDNVILRELTLVEADRFYAIYAHPKLSENFDESPFLPNESSIEFTERIISLCECIFTIRPTANPNLIIGDCALHHWNKQSNEISIGGSLFPEYWGKGYMKYSFNLLIEIAKEELAIKTIVGQTKIRNLNAIRLVQKMGFIKRQLSDNDIILSKEI